MPSTLEPVVADVVDAPAVPCVDPAKHFRRADGTLLPGHPMRFPKGTSGFAGCHLGVRAKTIVSRKEVALTQTAVALALNGTPATKEQAAQLRQFIDKLVPDATISQPVVQINFAALPGGLTDEEWREARR